MATITDTDVAVMYRALYRKGQGKEEVKADGLLIPDKIKAIFQALDDWFEAERPTIKAAIDSGAGRTMSVAAAKKYAKVWLHWKWGLE